VQVNSQSSGRLQEALAYAAHQIEEGAVDSREELEKLKKRVSAEYSLDRYPSNSEIISSLTEDVRSSFEELLRVHPRRSASGIVVVTAFSAPFFCPHGTCVFCPGCPKVGTPQSYLPGSPGMKTALAVGFDPFLQVRRSLEKYRGNGHQTGKVEAIIEGGTFIAVPVGYQKEFVKGVYEGLNGSRSSTLEEAQVSNETSTSRCVGLTLESKPDWCKPTDIDLMLSYGITRLEIGVQSLDDEVLSLSHRGHTVEDTEKAFQVARDAGMKVTAHMMPGLPGATPHEDLGDLHRLFKDEALRPDMSKLYPTLVVPGTSLAMQFRAGLYQPYDLETVVDLLSEMKRFVPTWHRIMRIQREIPASEISGGVRNGNLRQMVLERASQKGFQCNCIRCREVALLDPADLDANDSLQYQEERFKASGGIEVFGSYEYKASRKIAGFVRVRLPSENAHRPEMAGSAIVRELRVYGRLVELGRREDLAWQHRGIGRSLLDRMESMAREDLGVRRLLVTAAVGTRNYYRKLGYELEGPYVRKELV
jgi:elongator complex protein 3